MSLAATTAPPFTIDARSIATSVRAWLQSGTTVPYTRSRATPPSG